MKKVLGQHLMEKLERHDFEFCIGIFTEKSLECQLKRKTLNNSIQFNSNRI